MALPLPAKKKNDAISKRTVKEHENLSPEELQKFMRKHGISDYELAEILGVTIQGVNLWLSGGRKFSITNSRLLRMFDKNPELIRDF